MKLVKPQAARCLELNLYVAAGVKTHVIVVTCFKVDSRYKYYFIGYFVPWKRQMYAVSRNDDAVLKDVKK